MRSVAASLLGLLLCASAALGQSRKLEAEANRLLELRPELPSAVMIQQPVGLDYRLYDLADGSQVVVLHTGPKAQQIVLLTFANGPKYPEVTQWVITVGKPRPGPDEPDVPPAPDPYPDGFAGEVARQADAAKIPREHRLKTADTFEAVASMVGAGAIKSIADVMQELEIRGAKVWPESASAFVAWFGAEFTNRVQTLANVIDTFPLVAKGLRHGQ